MRNRIGISANIALVFAIAFVCCSCSSKPNPEALGKLEQMSSAVQDMGIVVSAGVTQSQYSERLTNALLKFGNSDDRCQQAIAELSTQARRTQAREICQHLREAMEAYTYAKDFFGPKYDPIAPDFPNYTLKQETYAQAKQRFPTLADLPVSETNDSGYKFYSRDAMVQALWKVAEQDAQAAKGLIEKLSQS
jgi:hypothetical protein